VVPFPRSLGRLPGDGPDIRRWRKQSRLRPRPCWCLALASGWFRASSPLARANTRQPPGPAGAPTLLLARRWGTNHRPGLAGLGQLVVAPTARDLQRGPPDRSRRWSRRVAGGSWRGDQRSRAQAGRAGVLLPQWRAFRPAVGSCSRSGALACRTRLLAQRAELGGELC